MEKNLNVIYVIGVCENVHFVKELENYITFGNILFFKSFLFWEEIKETPFYNILPVVVLNPNLFYHFM